MSLLQGEIPRLAFSEDGISGVIHNFPFYYSAERPLEKLQEYIYVSELALNITNYEVGGNQRLFDTANPFQNYDLTIPIDDDVSLRVEFRFDRQGDPNELVFAMIGIIEKAYAAEGIKFVTLRR